MSADEKDDLFLDLNFAPSWARTSPDANVQHLKGGDRFDRSGEEDSPRHGRGGKGGGFDRRPRRNADDRSPPRSADRRPPRRDGDRRGARPDEMPRPESRAAVVDFSQPRPPQQPRDDRDRRRPNDDGYRPRDREPYPQQPALPLDVRILPEQKALGAVMRRIQTSHRAYPLRDIAWLFLDNPNACLIRIEPLKGQSVPLFQCKICGYPALTEEEVRAHLMNRHLEDFFDVEEVDCEPPSGAFVCVARCTLSGELLGPPNHHSFTAKVQEMLRTRYANMSEESYRSRIEMVRDAEVVEQWRQQCTRKKVYRRKGVVVEEAPPPVAAAATEPPAEDAPADVPAAEPLPKAPPVTREVAELVFMREVVPGQLTSAKYLICTAGIAAQTSSRPLAAMLRDMLSRERRFPASIFFALRGAFRHRKLYLFRVNDARGQDFVMLKTPAALDPAHAVQTLRDILTYVQTNPACTKADLVATLAGTEEAKRKEVLIQLAWLVEKGHIIEYYNDVLSIPCEYPAFRFVQGEKGYHGGPRPVAAKAPLAAETEEAVVTEEVVAEEAAPPEEALAEPPVAAEPEEAVAPPPAEAEAPAEPEPETESVPEAVEEAETGLPSEP